MAWLLLAFIVVPFFELYLLIQVGQQIGALPTIGIVLLISLLGSWLVKREGVSTWRRMRDRTHAGQVPGRELADGALILFAGALLLTPGFASDVVGLLLLFPPSRAIARTALMAKLASRSSVVIADGMHLGGPATPPRRGHGPDDVIDV